MLIVSFFTDQGAPKPGLTPTIDIIDIDLDSIVVNGAVMAALTGMTHVYIYNFAENRNKNYAITVDGGITLNDLDRYQFGTNDPGGTKDDVLIIKKIETGRWKIEGTQMILYDENKTTALYTFDLKDINGTATNRNIFERDPA